MVRNYTDKELLDKVKSLDTFKGIPEGYWILGVRSKNDEYNKFDDKFYIYQGEEFVTVTTGTTNSGAYGLKRFSEYGKDGVAVLKANTWLYDFFSPGLHKGKMKALVQTKPAPYYRDGNGNNLSEEIGKVKSGIIGLNFHTVSYDPQSKIIKDDINGWSTGCQVCNNVPMYYKILRLMYTQPYTTYCLIDEF